MKNWMTYKLYESAQGTLMRVEDGIRNVLALLSAIAVGLVVANEFLTPEMKLPLISLQWGELQSWLRAIIWLVFVAYCITYGVVSKNKLEYLRTHMLELLVCVAWIPNYQYALFHHFNSLLSITSLQLIGTLAHAWRVARWTIKRFSTHPMIVTGSAALVLVSTASVFLNQIEPQTFPTIWDAGWYCMSTVTTVGYGDLVPKTAFGKVVGVVVMIGGISLGLVLFGLMAEYVRNCLPIKPDANAELQKQMLAELRANNQLLSELLGELRKGSKDGPEKTRLETTPEKPAEQTE